MVETHPAKLARITHVEGNYVPEYLAHRLVLVLDNKETVYCLVEEREAQQIKAYLLLTKKVHVEDDTN